MERDIKKLKQLDRIEYRIKDLTINTQYIFSFVGSIVFVNFVVASWLLIYFLASSAGELEKYEVFVSILGLSFIFVGWIILIYGIISLVVEKLRLRKEYFKSEAKEEI